jgi:hypothetical protein
MSIIKRVAVEPSSWAGLAAILQAVALAVPQYGTAIAIVQAVCGAVAVAQRENT